MTSLELSKGQTLLACIGVAWLFFWLSWLLERPLFVIPLRKFISNRFKLSQTETDNLVSGIHTRTVNAVHNTFQVALSIYALWTCRELWEDKWYGTSSLSEALAIVSSGFFIWDFAASIRCVKSDGPAFIMHGLLCAIFYIYVAVTGNHHFYGCGFILWELSTPFVHLRWLLYRTGFKKSPFYLYNGLTMMVVFGCCRILWGGYLSLSFAASSLTEHNEMSWSILLPLYALCILLNGLNWTWFLAMVKGAVRLMMKKPLHVEDAKIKENGVKQD